MWRTLLILSLAGLAACSSTSESMQPDPFHDAEPVEGGLYAGATEMEPTVSNGFVLFLNDEWKRSVSGWSFTGRSLGNWIQRDWNRMFGDSR